MLTSILFSHTDVISWKPIPYRAFEDISQEYIVPSDGQKNIKKRILIQDGCDLLYINKQELLKIDITNMIICKISHNIYGDGVKLSQNQCNFQFYGDVDSIYGSLRKFTLQYDFTMKYLVKKQIGKGAYGKVYFLSIQVYLAKNKIENQDYAVKVFEKALLQQEQDIQTLKKELQILRDIDHKNLLKIYETFESDTFIYIVCELIIGGSLSQLMKEQKKYNENEIFNFAQLILGALNHLHDKGIMHRDIKPSNILLRNKGSINDVVLIDFGLSDYYNKEGQYIFTQCGTPGYMAPEILKNKEYDYKVDIYSLGIILHRLVTGHSPFNRDNEEDLIQFNSEQIMKTNILNKNTKMTKIIEQMTQSDPQLRINCKQALISTNRNKISLQIIPQQSNSIQDSPVSLRSQKSSKSINSPNSICQLPQLFESRQKYTNSSYQPSLFRTKRILS